MADTEIKRRRKQKIRGELWTTAGQVGRHEDRPEKKIQKQTDRPADRQTDK